ncbi:MAG: outer membrane beta-barrel protein [Verrucomicrobiota bacterium]|nr:outer membrane beta-barrel protein [Verrucomicrobiota bacterium]
MNNWTVGLAAAGVVSLASTAQAEENSVLTSLGSTVLSGSVEASYVGSFSSDNNLYGDDGFNANGASLSIGSPLGGEGYAAGYNVELLLGQRAADFSGEGDDFHIKNANIGMSLPVGNGIDLTLGLFDTIVGYEVEASAANPNVSRSYGFDLEPFTHTGLMASTSLMDNVSLTLGAANAFDSTSGLHNTDVDGSFAFLGGIEVTAPDSLGPLSGSTVYVGIVDGSDDDNQLLYVGASIPTPIEGLSLGVAYDDRESATGDAEATAVYATYGLSETMNLGLRYDTLEDDRAGAWEGDTRSALTATLGIALFDNVLTRIEYIAEDGNRAGGSSNGFEVNAFYSF